MSTTFEAAGRQSRAPAEIRELRGRHPQMRERDFARIHGISEAELVAAYLGDGVTRLRPEVRTLLEGLRAVGPVMALTRNDSAVHEKIGPYEKVFAANPDTAMVLGDEIDLRIFPREWASGFAVEKRGESGVRRSLQFFDAQGEAVHKVHLREQSNEGAFLELVAALCADDQSARLEITSPPPPVRSGPPAGYAELREHWAALTDTHQFFGMLKKLNLSRHEAVHLIDRDYAWPLRAGAVVNLLTRAAAMRLPIMVFVGNRGCIRSIRDRSKRSERWGRGSMSSTTRSICTFVLTTLPRHGR